VSAPSQCSRLVEQILDDLCGVTGIDPNRSTSSPPATFASATASGNRPRTPRHRSIASTMSPAPVSHTHAAAASSATADPSRVAR